uniref:hypothetical protein n=1 Tax=Pedobacter sp. TaxID=1411316 RepID=UPI00159B527D|nr:hypothetical protein [Pedobacter sp.]QJS06245.1 hypothetical protein [Pedobacter sp.]
MKRTLLTLGLLVFSFCCFSQKKIKDEAIIHQQERMVYKQWDKDKFTPEWKWWKPNSYAAYAATWLLHPNYKDLDRRPLKPGGEHTQRLALAAAMQVSSNYYKKETDTLRNTALTEITNYAGAVSSLDPLYNLYYKKELAPLDDIKGNAFMNVPQKVIQYLAENGSYNWYLTEMNSLLERFSTAKRVDVDRGQRILMYHRIMLEHRKLVESWKHSVDLAAMMLDYRDKLKNVKETGGYPDAPVKSADERLDDIMKRRKSLQ